ncbi:MAG: hypothetical protein VB875_00780, partial [Pirellulales bacterium]
RQKPAQHARQNRQTPDQLRQKPAQHAQQNRQMPPQLRQRGGRIQRGASATARREDRPADIRPPEGAN